MAKRSRNQSKKTNLIADYKRRATVSAVCVSAHRLSGSAHLGRWTDHSHRGMSVRDCAIIAQ
jgi:hypothetical protein